MATDSIPLRCQRCAGWVVHEVAANGDGYQTRCTCCGTIAFCVASVLPVAECVDRLWTDAIRASVRQSALRPPCRAGVVLAPLQR